MTKGKGGGLGGGYDAWFPEQSVVQPSDRPTSEPADQSTVQPVDQSTTRTVEQPTVQLVKATVYMPADDEKKLDDLWRELQRRAGPGNRRKVTKGDILARALREALKAWKDDATLNQLAVQLVEQSTSRTAEQ